MPSPFINLHSSQLLSFETLLEDICDRLQDTKQQYSLKRIQKMEETLDSLEQELEELAKAVCDQTGRGMG